MMNAVQTSQRDNQNQSKVFTYIAIPIEALQQCNGPSISTLSDAQNLIFKAISDGVINQPVQASANPENIIVKPLTGDRKIHAQLLKNAETTSRCTEKLVIGRQSVIENKTTEFSNGVRRKFIFSKIAEKPLVEDSKTKANVNSSNKDEVGSFKCQRCDLVLDKMSLYRKHMEMHRNTKKFKCDQCSSSYNVEDNLKLHMALHVKNEPTCPICDKKFQRLASLKSHIIVHEVDETFTCLECLSEFDSEDEYNSHMETHKKEKVDSSTSDSPMECLICSYVFEDSEQYKEHISYHIKMKKLVLNGRRQKRKMNTNKQYRHKCDICDKSFSKYCLLERHVRVHSGEKPFSCHLCDRAFAQKGTLQIHLIRHSGIRPFPCTLCSATFCQKGNLRVHVQKTHIMPAPGEKVFRCSMCTCIFKKVSSLNAHTTKAHARDRQIDDVSDLLIQLTKLENQLAPNNTDQKQSLESTMVLKNEGTDGNSVKYVKLVDYSVEGSFRRYLVKKRKTGNHQWYICSFCSKEFKKPSDLIRHIRVHTREKPFKCKHCDQAFSLKSTLSHHLNTHMAKRQYQCIVCLKMFTSIRALNAHRRRHDHSTGKHRNHYMCPTCSKVFNSVTKIKLHMKTHAETEKPVENPGEMDVIMQEPMMDTANGLLPVLSLKSKINLTESGLEKPRPHKCQCCNATFTRTVHLKRHMLIHSGERKFNCDICKKSFYSSYAKEHMKFHSGEKNFACKICGKKFVTNAILKRHVAIHSSNRPFVCPYCRKRFKTVLMCRKHINIHKRDLEVEQFRIVRDDLATNPPVAISESSQKVLQQSKILYTDAEKGIIISTPIDIDTEGSNALGNQPQIFESSSMYIEKPRNLSLLTNTAANSILNNVNREVATLNVNNVVETNESTFPTVYVNCEDLQSLSSANLYSACLSQLKNNDPLLVGGINEIQDPNLLFSTDPTLTQITDSQLDSQNLETLIPTFNFTNNLSLNQSFPNIVLSNIDDNEVNQLSLFPNEFNKKPQTNNKFTEVVDTPKFIIDSNLIDIPEESSAGSTVITNLLYNGNSTEGSLNITDAIDRGVAATFPASSSSKVGIMCSYCKQTIKSLSNLRDHICTVVVTEDNGTTQLKDSNQKNDKSTPEKGKSKIGYLKEREEPTLRNRLEDAEDLSKYKCTLCDKVASSKATYTRHYLTHMTVKEKNACSYCGKEFKKPSDLERHIRTHTGERPYKCDKCDKSFSLKSTLESHNRTHKPGGNKDFSCVVCNSYFSSKSSLRVHMLMHTGVRPYQCSLCPEKFRTSGHRKSHMSTHFKQGNTKKAKIKLLGSVAMDTQLNSTEEKSVMQDASLLDFKAMEGKETFQMILEESDPNQTIEVDPIFLQQLQLNNMLLQDNIDDELTSFIQVDVNNDGQITEVKSISNDLLHNLTGFETQLNTDTTENPDTERSQDNKLVDTKNFQCNICHKKYSSKSVLTKHKKIHIKNSSFKCTKCDTQLSSSGDLENHLKLHSGYRPFCCQLCANTFREEKNLKTHIRRIHGIV
ncbi:hypothetical protein RN001_011947 [Aquatica leii]|uniref:C2H2-type domain-containing protein n=1 Tax=Aquatica leii TaxID=1421715 RepID=A0AAN7Q174_9COLE|nr:hypothetical protein RN001_011947 [Aquatica leii]